MSGGEFAAKETYLPRTGLAVGQILSTYVHHPMILSLIGAYEDSRAENERLLAAVRERDNTIARVREVLDDYDGLDAEPIPKLSTYTWMHEVRAALDPQETE